MSMADVMKSEAARTEAMKTEATESEAPGPQSFASFGKACARQRQLTERTDWRTSSGTRAISTTFPSPGR